MIKPIIKSFAKITILTLVFFVLFYLWANVIKAWWWSENKTIENADNFASIDNYWLSEVWVALNINVWTKFYEWKKEDINNRSLYNEVISISTIKSDKVKTNEALITKNIDAIKDYVNISKIDVKSYINSSDERKENFDSLMNQIKIRYRTWYSNSQNLNIQINTIIDHLEQLDSSIENIKQSMVINLRNYNANALNKNIEDYLVLKNEVNLMRVYLIFCNRFLAYYNFLNLYNKAIITTLRLNEDAIVKNTYIILPNFWSELLEKYNLIYGEDALPENINITPDDLNVDNVDLNNVNIDDLNLNYIDSNTSSNVDYGVKETTNINGTTNWILWDPYNLKQTYSGTTKQSWGINFWSSKYTGK